MTITIEQAKNLRHGDTLYANFSFNRRGIPARIRITGRVRIWKRTPGRVQVPYKYGLYEYGYVTEKNLGDWCLTPEDAVAEMQPPPDRKIIFDPRTGATIRT